MTDIAREFPGPISASFVEVSEVLLLHSGSRVSGSLIPKVTDSPDHSLGKPDLPWKDAYLSSGSLFIDGVKTLHREGGMMKLGTGEDFEISGSLVGTASFAGAAETASVAETAVTASVAGTASFTETASLAETAATASIAGFAQAAPTTVTVHSGIVDQIVLDLFNTIDEIPDPVHTFRFLMDLSKLTEVRMVANVHLTECGSGSFVALQFSTDGETTWDYLAGSEQPQIPCPDAGSVVSGLWAEITGSAKQEVVMRLVGTDPTQTGNKSNTVEVGTFLLQFR